MGTQYFRLKSFLLYTVVMALGVCSAFSQEWALRAGGTQSDAAQAVAADAAGNTYVAGRFEGNATFGVGAGAVTLPAAGATDVFLAKYDSNSNFVWAVKAGGPLVTVPTFVEQAGGVAVDGSGNVYLAGWFHANGTFAGGTNTVILTSAGDEDLFLAKYTSGGTLLWVRRIGGELGDVGIGGVAIDPQNNPYLFASLDGTVSIGGSSPQMTLPATNDLTLSLIKFTQDGVAEWVEQSGSMADDSARGIAIDGAGNIHVLAQASSTTNVVFGKGTNAVSLSFSGTINVFLAKYAPNRNVLWATSTTSDESTANAGDVAVDASGNVYVTGSFNDPVTFGVGVSAVTLTNVTPVSTDAFLAKYSSTGSLAWAQIFGGDGGAGGSAVAVDATGNAWVSGSMPDTVKFGSGPTALTLFGAPASEGFIAQFSGSGTPLGAFKIGVSNGVVSASSIVAKPAVYVTGSFSRTATFNGVSNLSLTSTGTAQDIYLAKYGTFSPADLAVQAIVDKPAPPQGDTITFTVTVTNRGPSSAGQVRLSLIAPSGLGGITFNPSRGTYNTNTGLWTIGVLTNNTRETFIISGTTLHSSPITLLGQIAHSDRVDTVASNNAASATSQSLLPPGSSLVVTNTQDSGLGSLRNAIEFANSKVNVGGPDVITFAIPVGDPRRDLNGVCSIHVSYPLPLLTQPVVIDGLTQSGANNASWPPALKVAIVGTNRFSGGSGFHIATSNSTVRGMIIYGFQSGFDNVNLLELGGAGIFIDRGSSNVITCNFLGTDASGTNGMSSRQNDYGIRIVEAPNNVIGGTTVSLRNLIANNDQSGIQIQRITATNNVILGNFIGTTVTGMAALENGAGIEIWSAPRNIIGAADHDAGVCNKGSNLISGNDEQGILIDDFSGDDHAAGQKILGNFIGVSLYGTNALPNEDDGIEIADDGGGHTIGSATDPGVCSKGCNLISGNQFNGIFVNSSRASNNIIQGNFIGVDVTGMRDIGNGDVGIESSSHGNIIGGAAPGLGNVISGNGEEGIHLFAARSNVIQGNFIGVAVDGTTARNNTGDGVGLTGSDNLIGGTNTAERNVIAFNSGRGIGHNNLIGASNIGNRYLGNAIYSNGGMAIDLGQDNATGNDTDDSDTGPNEFQNYPFLNALPTVTGAGSTTVNGTLQSRPSTSYRIEFYANPFCDSSKFGEGQTFIGALQVTTSAGGTANFNQVFSTPGVPAGWVITSTATGPDGTSEFSQCADFPSQNFVTNTANSGPGSLREALLYASFHPGLDAIIFNIPTNDIGYNPTSGVWRIRATTALPVINHQVILDGTTQPGANCNQWPPVLKIEIQRTLSFLGNSNIIRGLILNSGSTAISLDGVGNVVQCNFIGTDSTGTQRRQNSGSGVQLSSNTGDVQNRIGGPLPTHRNLISANNAGISFFNSRSNIIENNYIGTDVTGTTNLGNNAPGINVSTDGNIIRNNLVSGNGLAGNPAGPNVGGDQTSDSGIFISGRNNVVQGNLVGTDISGTLSLSNRGSGIEIIGGTGNLIGGTTPGTGNVIAFNGDDGIELQTQHPNNHPIENPLLGNSIFSNTRFGIDLGDDGISGNDGVAGDVDQFWNQLQNKPEITLAGLDTNSNQVLVDYRVPSDPLNSVYPIRVEFFRADATNQEGQVFLGADEFTLAHFTGGTQRTASILPTITLSVSNRIVATATDAAGNTSEFSTNAVLVARQGQPKLSIARGATPGTLEVSWPIGSTNLQLQTATNLTAPVNWQNVTSGITDDGGLRKYMIQPTGRTNRFYRLQQP